MNLPHRLQQVEALFHATLEQQPAARTAFLALVCAGDQLLLEAVNALLAGALRMP